MAVTLFNPDMERLTGPALEAVQLEKLQRLVVRVYERSPHYREKFDAADLDPRQLRSLADYADYPLFDKEEERLSQQRSLREEGHPFGMHMTCDLSDVELTSASSGTTFGASPAEGIT